MVMLPAYNPGNSLDFSPVSNALAQVTYQNNANRQYGLEQQQSARADQELNLRKQETASALKTQAAQYENLTHQILASTAQGALSVQDPNARASIANGIISGHPEMANQLTQYGVDPKNPDGVLSFFANYGQNPLDIQAKKAQIAQTQTATAVAGAPQPVIVGTDVFGSKYANRNPLTGELTPLDEKIAGSSIGTDMVKNLADGIASGQQPPVVGQGQGTGAKINAAVKSELQRRGFDLTKANLEYEAAHKQVLSLNGPQMVRYKGLTDSVINTINDVNDLAGQLGNSGITGLNAAKLAALTNTAGNTPQGQLATKYLTAVNTLKEEFANLAQGGYAPTEAAWDLANKQINANFGVDQLQSSLKEVQRLLNYRLQAIPNMGTLGPGVANRYVGNAPPPQIGGAMAAPQAAPPSVGQGQPASPQTAPSRPRAVNPQTGHAVEWDGTKWVDVQ